MKTNLMLLLAAAFCFVAGWFSSGLVPGRQVRLEDRFLDECQWAPQVPQQPDGSVPARVARNPYPLCFLELQRAKHLTTTLQLTSPPPPEPEPAPASAKP